MPLTRFNARLVWLFLLCWPISAQAQQSRLASERAEASACISRLLATSGPSAISRFVIAIDVDAVKGASFWACSHVIEEILERRQPSLTHRNTTPSVIPVIGIVRVEASSLHRSPRPEFFREPIASCVAVEVLSAIRDQAPAALGMAGQQVLASHDCHRAAVAATFPIETGSIGFAGPMVESQRGEALEALPGKVFHPELHRPHSNT